MGQVSTAKESEGGRDTHILRTKRHGEVRTAEESDGEHSHPVERRGLVLVRTAVVQMVLARTAVVQMVVVQMAVVRIAMVLVGGIVLTRALKWPQRLAAREHWQSFR